MTKWEIKIVETDANPDASINKLNQLANDGWELVAVTATSRSDGFTNELLFSFKRPKTN